VFEYIELDPESATSRRTWPEPDACEVLNGKRLDDFDRVLADVVGILRSGKKITATGTSDVHGDLGIGYARTLIRSDEDDPAALELPAIWRALREGRAIATNGPFVTITATAAGGLSAEIGDTIRTRDPVTVEVVVRAPSWMVVDRVILLENGVPVFDRPASAGGPSDPSLRFRGSYTSVSAGDLFFMARVEGGRSPPPGKEGPALTNPIFVDRD
jgi:hypothetical protein